jgi:hypothetical protein
MRNEGQGAENSITIFENANGVTTNNIVRTTIEWGMVRLPDGQGGFEDFYEIIVHEPAGSMTRNAKMTINLLHEDIHTAKPFYFIFHTGIGNVELGADQPVSYMLVNSVVIGSGSVGRFTFPNTPNPPHHPFEMRVNELIINSSCTINMPCGAGRVVANVAAGTYNFGVVDEVVINGSGGTYTFREVGTGGIHVEDGLLVSVTAHIVHGDVYYNSRAGNLALSYYVDGDIFVRTTAGSVTIREVYGNIDFETNGTGSLTGLGAVNVGSGAAQVRYVPMVVGWVSFVSTSYGSINLPTIHAPDNLPAEGAPIVVRSHGAAVTLGGTHVGQGIHGSVDIQNDWGVTIVNFARRPDLIGTPAVTIVGWNARVEVTNIVGLTDIRIKDDGKGQVIARFREIVDGSTIHCIGIYDHAQPDGRIFVVLQVTSGQTFMPFFILAEDSANPRDHTGWPPGSTIRDGVRIYNDIPYAVNGATEGDPELGIPRSPTLRLITENFIRIDVGS